MWGGKENMGLPGKFTNWEVCGIISIWKVVQASLSLLFIKWTGDYIVGNNPILAG